MIKNELYSLNSSFTQPSPICAIDTPEQQERRDWNHILAMVASLQKELPARKFPKGSSFDRPSKDIALQRAIIPTSKY